LEQAILRRTQNGIVASIYDVESGEVTSFMGATLGGAAGGYYADLYRMYVMFGSESWMASYVQAFDSYAKAGRAGNLFLDINRWYL
jgi:hypothetical protein